MVLSESGAADLHLGWTRGEKENHHFSDPNGRQIPAPITCWAIFKGFPVVFSFRLCRFLALLWARLWTQSNPAPLPFSVAKQSRESRELNITTTAFFKQLWSWFATKCTLELYFLYTSFKTRHENMLKTKNFVGVGLQTETEVKVPCESGMWTLPPPRCGPCMSEEGCQRAWSWPPFPAARWSHPCSRWTRRELFPGSSPPHHRAEEHNSSSDQTDWKTFWSHFGHVSAKSASVCLVFLQRKQAITSVSWAEPTPAPRPLYQPTSIHTFTTYAKPWIPDEVATINAFPPSLLIVDEILWLDPQLNKPLGPCIIEASPLILPSEPNQMNLPVGFSKSPRDKSVRPSDFLLSAMCG